VFRDELEGLFPADPDARRLESRTFLLAEFLQSRGASYRPPALSGKAMLQLHCHQGAILDHGEEEKALLSRTGLDVEVLDSGCCGMAGSFGFEAGDHYDVSIRCGERVLLPRVREAAPGTLVVADGFSCREQIVQQTGRRALHIAEILRPPAPAQGA